jgi:hypothetical protein
MEYGIVKLTKELAKMVLSRRKTIIEISKKEDTLSDMHYWDASVTYADDDSNVELSTFFEDDNYDNYIVTKDEVPFVESEYTPRYDNYTVTKDEVPFVESKYIPQCSQMVIGIEGVYWTCYPKHVADCLIETPFIPYYVFEGAL